MGPSRRAEQLDSTSYTSFVLVHCPPDPNTTCTARVGHQSAKAKPMTPGTSSERQTQSCPLVVAIPTDLMLQFPVVKASGWTPKLSNRSRLSKFACTSPHRPPEACERVVAFGSWSCLPQGVVNSLRVGQRGFGDPGRTSPHSSRLR